MAEEENHISEPYLCPNCKTNRTRFNLIEQKARILKLDPASGSITAELTAAETEPYHMTYQGPAYLIHCGVCGLVEQEDRFIHYARYHNKE